MLTSVNNMTFNVIDLSSDDEDSFQEKASTERQTGLSKGRPHIKDECPQRLGNTQIEQSMHNQAVQHPELLSNGHDFDWYLQDVKPDVQHIHSNTRSSVPPVNLQGESRLEQNRLRQDNGVIHPVINSLYNHERSAQHTSGSQDNHGSGQTLLVSQQMLNRQGENSSHVTSLRSNGLSQPVQQIQNDIDTLQTTQNLQVNKRITSTLENTSPVTSSMHKQSEVVPSQSSFRQFWKAGDYDVQNLQKKSMPGRLDHVRVHPKFLHSNATSHKWAFGAIAELLDNAVDEILHGATYAKVDQIYNTRDYSHALLVQDDGGGMDPECIRQCMSLGYSMKNTNATIGQYGNGFKTSTMRLGADVIVFTRTACGSSSTQSIGLLSYTFLRKTNQDDIIVPMVDFELPTGPETPRMLIRNARETWKKNLDTILEWSPYTTETELMKQFDDIGPHGTKIILYNLWLNDDGILELDFDSDKEDIKLRGGFKTNSFSKSERELLESHISYRLQYSLRAYTSVLYLRRPTNFNIILRGKPVEYHNIADDLKFSKVITYKPQLGPGIKEVVVETTIGFTKEAPFVNIHGFNVYHKNRLIMPFWKVLQDASSRGRGVVGILEANFIEPAHDKQDFERTAVLLRLEAKLKQMTLDYWKANCNLVGYQGTNRSRAESQQRNSQSIQNPQPLTSRSSQNNLPSVQSPHPLAHIVSGQGVLPPQISNNSKMPVSAVQPSNLQIPTSGKELQSVAETSQNLQVKVSEENLQLFMRCEHYRQTQMQLNQTIKKLENELNTAKQKVTRLAADANARKKQKLML